MKRLLVLAVVLTLVSTPAMAELTTTAASMPAVPLGGLRDFVVDSNPYDGVQTYGSACQDFETAYDGYDTSIFVDFTAATDVNLTGFSSMGFTNGTVEGGLGANAAVWTDLPWNGGIVLATSSSGTNTLFTDGLITGTFANDFLAAGSYWLELQPVQDYATAGQSYLYQTEPQHMTGDEQYNYGGAFGMPDNHQATGTDINFELTGVPEPGSLALLCVGALALVRRRR